MAYDSLDSGLRGEEERMLNPSSAAVGAQHRGLGAIIMAERMPLRR